VPPTRNFSFDMYVRKGKDKFIKTSRGEVDFKGVNGRLSRQQLYLKWLGVLRNELKRDTTDPIIGTKLPPD
jgi:hypothetical protein